MHLLVSDTMGMNVLYQPIEKYDPVGSVKLHKFDKASSMPFDVDTVQKMS
jgi:hypothetical protein